MTSICEGQLTQNKAFSKQNKCHLGSREHILLHDHLGLSYTTGVAIYVLIHDHDRLLLYTTECPIPPNMCALLQILSFNHWGFHLSIKVWKKKTENCWMRSNSPSPSWNRPSYIVLGQRKNCSSRIWIVWFCASWTSVKSWKVTTDLVCWLKMTLLLPFFQDKAWEFSDPSSSSLVTMVGNDFFTEESHLHLSPLSAGLLNPRILPVGCTAWKLRQPGSTQIHSTSTTQKSKGSIKVSPKKYSIHPWRLTWNLKNTGPGRGKSSEPNHHFQVLY